MAKVEHTPIKTWTCPRCEHSWFYEEEEAVVAPPQEARYCLKCGVAPSDFRPGEVVRVPARGKKRSSYGVVVGPEQLMVVDPADRLESRIRDDGPWTGYFRVGGLEGLDGRQPCASYERQVISLLAEDPNRRAEFVEISWVTSILLPSDVERLKPGVHKRLFPALRV